MLVLDKPLEMSLLRVVVHPEHPDRWLEQPYHDDLRIMARMGLMGTTKETFYLTAVVNSRIVLPHKDLPYPTDHLTEVIEVGRQVFYQQHLSLSLEEEFERCLEQVSHEGWIDDDQAARIRARTADTDDSDALEWE